MHGRLGNTSGLAARFVMLIRVRKEANNNKTYLNERTIQLNIYEK